jgi:hypothetical protein
MAVSPEKAWLIRLPVALYDRWSAQAQAQGMSAPQLLRRAMVALLDGSNAPAAVPSRTEAARSGHISLTLRRGDREAVRQACRAEGHTLSGWLAALIRARLNAAPVLTAEELQALEAATLQLAAVGRNLNSAVYRLHREDRWFEEAARLSTLASAVKKVTARMNAVVERATERGQF